MEIDTLIISSQDMEIILNHCLEEYPREACGMLMGCISGNRAIVKHVAPTRNIRKSMLEFEIHPNDLYKLWKQAERSALDLIGVYHSHPGNPSPSNLDLKYMKSCGMIWMIIGMGTRPFKINAYDGSSLNQIRIELV